MNIDRLKESLSLHEDRRSKVYDDADGKPLISGQYVRGYATIGVGRNLVRRGLFEDEIDLMLANDIAAFTAEVYAALPWANNLPDHQQEVLVEMALNLGTKGMLGFTHMLEHLKHKGPVMASHEMLSSRWAKQVGQRALTLAKKMRGEFYGS